MSNELPEKPNVQKAIKLPTTWVFAIAGHDVVSFGFGSLLCCIHRLDFINLAVEDILYISFQSAFASADGTRKPCHRKYLFVEPTLLSAMSFYRFFTLCY